MFRLAIFIDGGYLDAVLLNEFGGAKISYDRFAQEVASLIRTDIDLLRTYYYHCLPWKSPQPTPEESSRFGSMQKFMATLDKLPRFEVRQGRLARRRDRAGGYYFQQKGVDVLMSIDLVKLSVGKHITHAALVTGDSDFVPAVEEARHAGVSIWLVHGQRPHNELWTVADERVLVTTELIDRVRWIEYSGD
jgi:uncharacterized LabA/DUF88 family protein